MSTEGGRIRPSRPRVVDDLDRRIIAVLQEDGRIGNAEIARRMGTNEGTIRRRLNRLFREEIISVIAIPNVQNLGFPTTALIGIQTSPGKSDSVAEALAQLEEVQYVAVTTGAYDIFVSARAESAEALGDFLRVQVGTIAGVQHTRTFVNLSVKKRI